MDLCLRGEDLNILLHDAEGHQETPVNEICVVYVPQVNTQMIFSSVADYCHPLAALSFLT